MSEVRNEVRSEVRSLPHEQDLLQCGAAGLAGVLSGPQRGTEGEARALRAKRGERDAPVPPLLAEAGGYGAETEAETVLAVLSVLPERTGHQTTELCAQFSVGRSAAAGQLRKVFAQLSVRHLLERPQQGRVVPQKSLQVSWLGGWSRARDWSSSAAHLSHCDILYKLADAAGELILLHNSWE